MIYVGCVLVVCLSGLVGNSLVKIFVLRDKFYKEILRFVQYLIVEIDFYQTKIHALFIKYINENNTIFKTQLNEIMQMIIEDKREEKKLDAKSFYFLKHDDKKSLETYFLQIGNKGVDIEVSNLKRFEGWVKAKSKDVEVQRKNNEGLIYKLSLAIGAVICILIV